MLGFEPLAVVALSDDVGSLSYSLVADSGTFDASGQQAAFIKDINILLDAGSYAFYGQDALLKISRLQPADQGAFALSGQSATLLPGYIRAADVGLFLLGLQDSGLNKSIKLASEAGVFAVADQTFAISASLNTTPETGVFSASGQPAIIGRSYILQAGSAEYSASIQDVFLLTAPKLPTGGYDLIQQQALFSTTKLAQHVQFALAAQDVLLAKGYSIASQAGQYAVSGGDLNTHISKKSDAGIFGVYQNSASFVITSKLDAPPLSLDGQAAFFGVTIFAGVGAYSASGQPANSNVKFAHEAENYVLSANDPNIFKALRLVADTSDYSFGGINSSIQLSWNVPVNAGHFSFLFTETDVDIKVVSPGMSLSVSGQDVVLGYGQVFPADVTAFSVQQQEININISYKFFVESGSILASRQGSLITLNRVVQAGAGTFALSGTDAGQQYRARRFEFAGNGTSIVFASGETSILLSQSGPNTAIISAINNEAA